MVTLILVGAQTARDELIIVMVETIEVVTAINMTLATTMTTLDLPRVLKGMRNPQGGD